MKKFDVVAMGELLVDFTSSGVSAQGNSLLEVNPGGAPCNFLAMLSNLDFSTAFIGKVGYDNFGKMLCERVKQAGINTDFVYTDEKVHTTLAFVHTLEGGDREFSFCRNPGADMMINEAEIPTDLIKNAKVFHFGTLSMTDSPSREATKKAVKIAKDNGVLVSFDPNLRVPLWNSLDEAKVQFDYGMKNCDILKISDNEIQWFTGKENFDEGIEFLQEKYKIPVISLSLGKDGSRVYYKNMMASAPTFLNVKTVETTGAGDTFAACVVGYFLEKGFENITKNDLTEMLIFANAAASIVTTRKGALSVMPIRKEIAELIKKII